MAIGLDNIDRSDLFFYKINYKKNNGFDSYSKSQKDILNFYFEKYPEVSPKYKNEKPLSIDLLNSWINKKIKNINCLMPFEKYIIAFLYAMNDDYLLSKKYFYICYNELDDGFECSEINRIFILLQIAQLYQRIGEIKESLSILFQIHNKIVITQKLELTIHSFLASCCVSMGLIYLNYYQLNNIANHLFLRSIFLRLKYKDTYDLAVFYNYLTMAYRNFAISYNGKNENKLVFFKSAYKHRKELLNSTNDEFTKKEFLYLSFDYILFLIANRYKQSAINRIVKLAYLIIVLLNDESKYELSKKILTSGVSICKYYYFTENYKYFYKWYSLLKYIKLKFQMDFNEHFLESEKLYNLIIKR
jgi:hypothetical protein